MSRDYTPSELQIVSHDAVVSKEEVYEFDAIVTHRGEPGNREYKIRWKNYSPEHDSWIPLKNFTDPQAVVKYWKRVKGSVPLRTIRLGNYLHRLKKMKTTTKKLLHRNLQSDPLAFIKNKFNVPSCDSSS